MADWNALLPEQSPVTPVLATPTNALLPAAGVNSADAYNSMVGALSDWITKQRADASARGLWNDTSGLPTQAGLIDAMRQYGGALVAGTSAPAETGVGGVEVNQMLPQPIRAYHGSPHDFDAFDASKIGTGEGAQAYGRGLYVAGNEAVARSYKGAGPAANEQLDAINSRMSQLANIMNKDAVPGAYRKFRTDEGANAAAEYDALMDKRSNLGHMYEVNINANPDHFLDWDKPLSEQSPHVQKAVASMPEVQQMMQSQAKLLGDKALNPFGQSMYAALTGWKRGVDLSPPPEAAAAAAQALKDAGIAGIRYLDGGSRAEGKGTHNHVVFDADAIEILKKYGLAGLVAGGAAAGAAQTTPQQ